MTKTKEYICNDKFPISEKHTKILGEIKFNLQHFFFTDAKFIRFYSEIHKQQLLHLSSTTLGKYGTTCEIWLSLILLNERVNDEVKLPRKRLKLAFTKLFLFNPFNYLAKFWLFPSTVSRKKKHL